MKFVLRYMAAYRKESIMAPLLKMLEAVFELLVPFVVAAIIDNGIINKDSGYIIRMALLMIGIAIVGAGFSLTAQYFAAKTATGVSLKIRSDLNTTILNMSKETYRRFGKSTLLTRMTSDVNALQNALNMFLRLLLRSPFIVVGAFIMSMIIDVKMSMIIGAIIVVLSIIVFFVMRATSFSVTKIQSMLDHLITRIKNDYVGAKLIRGFVIQDEEGKRFDEETKVLYSKQLSAGRLSNILNPLTFAFVNLGIILVLYFGGVRVDSGELSAGEVVALLNYMSQILVELVKIANLIVLLIKGIPSTRRIKEVIDTSDTDNNYQNDGDKDESSIIESTREIVKSRLNNIQSGEKIGVIGPTGSGKSLLLSLYMDYVEDKSKVGYVPQEDSFFRGSIAENILLKEYANEDLDYALKASCFEEVVDAKGGIEYEVGKDAGNFSTGQKKRLALARALYKKPNMLLMDDVTNPLDMITERKVIDNVLNSDMTVIIASQKASAVMRADRIIVIDNLKVIDVGSHKELLSRCDLYYKMFCAQFPDMSDSCIERGSYA